ncbi:YidH family protein [[Mycobacterium] nativiensis]|uniref:DUF202 domain-containing protein n=1 Tax=[Mycobacterium] nativiensis TaxID=2855503 RepID=A0ABU5XXX5_9MYCO|nr:DUF202 domain-containing protein [Mycolicibacter sp. MYC340]MEB3032819.1 DUF202 domain-containing protein [Mycolicibacter sp. MYC340]
MRPDQHGSVRQCEAEPESGHEPDYRFTLANERTFLAWQRTALGLLAAAVALVQLLPESSVHGTVHILAGLLTILAIMAAGMGLRRWKQVDRAIRSRLPLPPNLTPAYLGMGLVILGALALVLVVGMEIGG